MRKQWAIAAVSGVLFTFAGAALAADTSAAPPRVVTVSVGQGGTVSVVVPTTPPKAPEQPYALTGNHRAQPAVPTVWVSGFQGTAIEVPAR